MAEKIPHYYLWSLLCFTCANVVISMNYGWRFFLIAEAIVAPYCLGRYLYVRNSLNR